MYCSVARPVNLFFIKKEKKRNWSLFCPFPFQRYQRQLPQVCTVPSLSTQVPARGEAIGFSFSLHTTYCVLHPAYLGRLLRASQVATLPDYLGTYPGQLALLQCSVIELDGVPPPPVSRDYLFFSSSRFLFRVCQCSVCCTCTSGASSLDHISQLSCLMLVDSFPRINCCCQFRQFQSDLLGVGIRDVDASCGPGSSSDR